MVDAEMHLLWAEVHRGQLAMGMRLGQCRNALSVSTNAHGTISNENEALSTQKYNAPTVNRNVQGTISDGNKTLLMQKHTSCEQKHAGDNQ